MNKELTKQVRISISNYINGSIGSNGYELVEDMDTKSLYEECLNKTTEKEHGETTLQDLSVMELFIKEYEKGANNESRTK